MDPTEELQTDLIPLEYPVVNGRQGMYPQPIALPPYDYAAEIVREPLISLKKYYSRSLEPVEYRNQLGETIVTSDEVLCLEDNTTVIAINSTEFPYRTESESPWCPGVACDVTLGARTIQIFFTNYQVAILTGPSQYGAPRQDDETMPRVISAPNGAILLLPESANSLVNQSSPDTENQQWAILIDYIKRKCRIVILNKNNPNLYDDERCWNYNKYTRQMLSFVS